ncbi:MAG: translation initiation factor IF-3 [bacterium]
MKRTWRRPQKKEEGKFFRSNLQIKAAELFLIDENDAPVGNVSVEIALKLAADAGLDLVEVNPTAIPPVCKILDFGQFKYEKEKEAHKKKVQQKKVDIKGIRLTVRISDNDFKFKLEQAKGFLLRGDKLKLELILRGRERQHPEVAIDNVKKFVNELEKTEGLTVVKEQDLTRKGSGFIMILFNKLS